MSLFDFVHISRVNQGVHRLPIEVISTVVQQVGHPAGQGRLGEKIQGRSVLLGLAVSDLEVECQFSDEHVGLQSDLVNTGRRQSDGETNEAHDGSVAFLSVRVGVLRPQLPHQ